MSRVTGQQHAANPIRTELNSGRAPDIQHIADESALTAREVSDIRDQVAAGRYREPPRNAPPRPAPTARPQPRSPVPDPAPADAWRRGLDHPVKRIARKAARVQTLIGEVVADLAAESERDALRAKEAELAAQLAKVRAQLTNKTTAAPAAPKESCPDCPWSGVRLGMHRALKHKEAS